MGGGYSRGTTDILIRSPPLSLPDSLAPTLRIDISNVLLNGELDTRDNDLYPPLGKLCAGQSGDRTRRAGER